MTGRSELRPGDEAVAARDGYQLEQGALSRAASSGHVQVMEG